jgi:hypothetical protein
MTPEQRSDYYRLAGRRRELEASEDEAAVVSWKTLEDLTHLRNVERIVSQPRPQCCEPMRARPPVVWSEGTWRLRLSAGYYEEAHTLGVEEVYETAPATFCPYCGASLPKVRLRETPRDDRVAVVADGGYYCDTCEERLMNCDCLPPEAAYEVVPTPTELPRVR